MDFNSKFNHSVKVPRLYKLAAKVAQGVSEGEGSIKQLVYKKKHPNIKALYALVVLLFQRSNDLDNLLKRSQLLDKEPRLDPWLARILITELLWGKMKLSSNCKPVQTVLGYEQILKSHLSDMTTNTETDVQVVSTKPRYVRVNTLILSMHEAMDSFQYEGWNCVRTDNKNDYREFLKAVSNLNEDEFLRDLHIPSLLIFPPRTEFFRHPGYKTGSLILQDKASCLPVRLLDPEPSSIVLDMCAAPGMKTTQLAAAMNDTGTIYAVERDQGRFELLNKIIQKSQASCIKTVNKDILRCDSSDFPGVQYILVDPSCSGSGMVNRLEIEEERSAARLERLAGLQIKILRSALTRYPDVKRVVYSTCSVYPEENEDVVRQVLETNELFHLVSAKEILNNRWLNFGSPDYGNIGKYCLYAKPKDDFTNGFFVAVFERVNDQEKNMFFNANVVKYVKNLQNLNSKRQGRIYQENKQLKDGGDGNEHITEKYKKYELNEESNYTLYNTHEKDVANKVVESTENPSDLNTTCKKKKLKKFIQTTKDAKHRVKNPCGQKSRDTVVVFETHQAAEEIVAIKEKRRLKKRKNEEDQEAEVLTQKRRKDKII